MIIYELIWSKFLKICWLHEFFPMTVMGNCFVHLKWIIRSDLILWEGLSKLEKNEDKFNVVNREIFSAIMGNVYNFDDEIIIIALKCLLNLINNSQYSEISEKSKKIIFDICNECIQNTNDQIEIISNEILNILHWPKC